MNALPYTGIRDVQRVGLSVTECARRVGRFGYFCEQLMRVQAGKMNSTANWDVKAMLGRQLWESAVHWGMWRHRIQELRGHEHLITQHAESKLADFFAELLESRDDAEFVIGLYGVALPALRDALHTYIRETNPLVDYPTVRLIRQVLLDLEAQIAFGQAIIPSPASLHGGEESWRSHLNAYLRAAGGVDGVLPEQPSFELPAPRSTGEFEVAKAFARDARFTTIVPKVNPYDESDTHEALLAKMWVRAQEMTAAELCASVLFEWDDLPYDGCLALARHCWDEVRHSLFGQAALDGEGIALDALPNWVGYAGHTMPFPPQKRYAHLAIATEAAMMKHPGGKRGEWEWARDKAHHALMTTFQDFDWADEVNHVGYGREWLVNFFYKGDRAKAKAVADETVQDRLAFYADYSAQRTQSDGY
jgi:hypothetical protein